MAWIIKRDMTNIAPHPFSSEQRKGFVLDDYTMTPKRFPSRQAAEQYAMLSHFRMPTFQEVK